MLMGKIGPYYYPDLQLGEGYNITKSIYDFPQHSMSVKMMAEKLGISARGGWTGMIIASLKKYGLVDGRGTLRATSLAEKLVNPKNNQEFIDAKKEIFEKIKLWTKIRKDYGQKALPSDFWAYLAEKIPVDRTIAQKKSEKIAKLYTEAVTFCFPLTPSNRNNEGSRRIDKQMSELEQNPTSQTPINPTGTVSYGSSEEYGIWVKKDLVAIEFAESQIEAIKSWLKMQKTKLETEKAS